MNLKKKIIYVADQNFTKKNFFNLKYLKNYKVIFNELGRTLKQNDLQRIFLKYPNIFGIVAGLEQYNQISLKDQKNLKVISRVGVGLDNLDLDYLRKTKIKVIKLKNELTNTVAELLLTLILVSLRQVISNINYMKKKKWKPIIGNDLEGKKIGILGFGKIGQKLCQKLKHLGADTFIFEKKKIRDKKIKKKSLKFIFEKCDYICISLSLNNETKNLINSKILNHANKNIVIINASRGGVITEEDIYKFLVKNKNSRAFLDCFVKEPYHGKLLKLKNVYGLPHIASYTHETREKMELSASKQLIEYLS